MNPENPAPPTESENQPENPESEKERKVGEIVSRLGSFTVRIFTELRDGKTDEAQARSRLATLRERTFVDLDAVLGKTGRCSDAIEGALSSASGLQMDPGGPMENVMSASLDYVREVERGLVQHFAYNTVASSPDRWQQVIDSSMRSFNFKPSKVADDQKTRFFSAEEIKNLGKKMAEGEK